VQAVGLTELYASAAPRSGAWRGWRLPPIAIVGLFFAPLLLHGFATTVAAVGASRSRTYYVLTLALATLLHAAYNFGVVRLYA